MSSESELESIVFNALVENDGYYPDQLADRIADAVRKAGFVREREHIVIRTGDPLPSCQHYRIDNETGRCVACDEQMVTQRMEAKTVLSAPNAAGCTNPECLEALERGDYDDSNPPAGCTNTHGVYVPDTRRQKAVVIGYDYTYECERCRNDGTIMRSNEPIQWDCGHSHRGDFVGVSSGIEKP